MPDLRQAGQYFERAMNNNGGVMIGYVRPTMVHGDFMDSLFIEANRAKAKVIGKFSEPHVDQARNWVVDQFMSSDCEWFLSRTSCPETASAEPAAHRRSHLCECRTHLPADIQQDR